jgi:hypothetical protein
MARKIHVAARGMDRILLEPDTIIVNLVSKYCLLERPPRNFT